MRFINEPYMRAIIVEIYPIFHGRTPKKNDSLIRKYEEDRPP